MKLPRSILLLLVLALTAPAAFAWQDTTTPPPRWEQLDEAQRQALVAELRDHWNSEPARRARMLERAQRWQRMTPEQREQARKGLERYEKMSPAERAEARAVFERTRGMDRDERHRFRKQWQEMSPEQRRQWIDSHPPQPGPKHPHEHHD